MSSSTRQQLPQSVIAWLVSEGVDPYEVGKEESKRYFRMLGQPCDEKSHKILKQLAADLELNIEKEVHRVSWMPSNLWFFEIPSNAPLAQSSALESGLIQGMDVASGAAVAALDLQQGHRCLDLCCSPGAKLTAIYDLVSASPSKPLNKHEKGEAFGSDFNKRGEVVGIDLSRSRMSVCRNIVDKHHNVHQTGSRIRLIVGDGTTFTGSLDSDHELIYDSEVIDSLREGKTRANDGRKRMNKSARAREAKRLKSLADSESKNYLASSGTVQGDEDELNQVSLSGAGAGVGAGGINGGVSAGAGFDRILVDAACTHDGSFKHIKKVLDQTYPDDETDSNSHLNNKKPIQQQHHENEEETTNISHQKVEDLLNFETGEKHAELQRKLISNAFDLLVPNGVMVYSTCSLTRSQNEGVVEWLLQEQPTAKLEPILHLLNTDDALKSSFDFNTVNREEGGGGGGGGVRPWREGGLPHTLRFGGRGTSGLFIARLSKSA